MKKKKKLVVLCLSGALIAGVGAVSACALLQRSPENPNGAGIEESGDEIYNDGIQVKFLQSKENSDGSVTKTFTYSIAPDNAPQDIKLTVAWLRGDVKEEVSDYVTASTDLASKTISVVCKQAFNNVIDLKVASASNPSVTSKIIVSYVQKWLGWKDYGEARSEKVETISKSISPTKVADYKTSMSKSYNNRYVPSLSTVYTKAYPDGNQPTYEVTYKSSSPYVEGTSVSGGTMAALSDAMNTYNSNTRGTIWTSDSSSTMVEAWENIYKGLTYPQQRELNASGFMGIVRTFSVKASLGAQEKTYDIHWTLKADVSKFSTFVGDISSITVETPSIDF